MSANGYRMLGFVVWHAGRWYLRRRLPSARKVLGAALLAGALGGLVASTRRGTA